MIFAAEPQKKNGPPPWQSSAPPGYATSPAEASASGARAGWSCRHGKTGENLGNSGNFLGKTRWKVGKSWGNSWGNDGIFMSFPRENHRETDRFYGMSNGYELILGKTGCHKHLAFGDGDATGLWHWVYQIARNLKWIEKLETWKMKSWETSWNDRALKAQLFDTFLGITQSHWELFHLISMVKDKHLWNQQPDTQMLGIQGSLWDSYLQTVVVLVHVYVKTTFRKLQTCSTSLQHQQLTTKACREFTTQNPKISKNLQILQINWDFDGLWHILPPILSRSSQKKGILVRRNSSESSISCKLSSEHWKWPLDNMRLNFEMGRDQKNHQQCRCVWIDWYGLLSYNSEIIETDFGDDSSIKTKDARFDHAVFGFV